MNICKPFQYFYGLFLMFQQANAIAILVNDTVAGKKMDAKIQIDVSIASEAFLVITSYFNNLISFRLN